MQRAMHIFTAFLLAMLIQQGRTEAQEAEPAFTTGCCGVKPLTPVIDMGNGIKKMKAKIIYLINYRQPAPSKQSETTEWAFYDCNNHKIAWGFRSDGADTEWIDAWNPETNEISVANSDRNPASWQRVMCR
jgi:hypothetical protein